MQVKPAKAAWPALCEEYRPVRPSVALLVARCIPGSEIVTMPFRMEAQQLRGAWFAPMHDPETQPARFESVIGQLDYRPLGERHIPTGIEGLGRHTHWQCPV